jgi:hypothetical protein
MCDFFFNLLTVLKTLSIAIDDIIPYTSLISELNDKKSIWFQRETKVKNSNKKF